MGPLTTILTQAASQFFTGNSLVINGSRIGVTTTPLQGLRTVDFTIKPDRQFRLIQQNPNKASEWGKLAKQGNKVIQVLEGKGNGAKHYVGVIVNGEVKFYEGENRQ